MTEALRQSPVRDEQFEEFEGSVARYIAWRKAQVDRIDRLEVQVELLVQRDQLLAGVVELLVELVDSSVQASTLSKRELLKAYGKPVDEFVAGAGESLRVSTGEQVAEVRGLLADLRSLVHQPLPVKKATR